MPPRRAAETQKELEPAYKKRIIPSAAKPQPKPDDLRTVW
jgi:hypothetical protein